jgi:transposase-like protein
MVDGVEFGGALALVAMGITTAGKKLILGLREGDTENAEVCKDLLSSLVERGLSKDEKFLFVLDGAKGLRAAVSSLDEAMEETLSVIRLKAGNLLIKTLSSTNPIESAFDKVRNNTRRVKRWIRNTDQVSRWAASGLVEAEAGFRTIKGFRQIKAFMQELQKENFASSTKRSVRVACPSLTNSTESADIF